MVRFELGVEDLAITRFGISPLTETVCSVVAVSDPSWHTLHLPWLRGVRTELDPVDMSLLLSLVGATRGLDRFRSGPSRAIPDFLTPRPIRFAPRFEDELAVVRATPPEIVRRDLIAAHAPDPVPEALAAATRPGRRPVTALRDRICDELAHYYDVAIAPSWPEMRLVLEADTTYRARRLATGGARSLFADMHPNLRWREGVLYIDEMISDHTVRAAVRSALRGRLAPRRPARAAARHAGRAAAHGRTGSPPEGHSERGLTAPQGAARHRPAHPRSRRTAGPLPAHEPRRSIGRALRRPARVGGGRGTRQT